MYTWISTCLIMGERLKAGSMVSTRHREHEAISIHTEECMHVHEPCLLPVYWNPCLGCALPWRKMDVALPPTELQWRQGFQYTGKQHFSIIFPSPNKLKMNIILIAAVSFSKFVTNQCVSSSQLDFFRCSLAIWHCFQGLSQFSNIFTYVLKLILYAR